MNQIKFFVFEACTETGYVLMVTPVENERDLFENFFQESFGNSIETVAIGDVVATDEEDAKEKVRTGNWEYSQN